MRKRLTLSLILATLAVSYAAMAVIVYRGSEIAERRLGAAPENGERQVRAYVEALDVDAAADTIRLRVSIAPGPGLRAARADAANVALRISVVSGDVEQDKAFVAGETLTPFTANADLEDGTVTAYPFDRFRADLRISARPYNGADGVNGLALPLAVTVWEGLGGWSLTASQLPGDAADGVRLRLDLRRTAAIRILATSLYGVMMLIAFSALTISGTIFFRVRPAESTLVSALTGMVFTLPAVRYGLPGSPPLGVHADLLVFFWAEIAVAAALALFIVTWARPPSPR